MRSGDRGNPEEQRNDFRERKRRTNKPKEAVKKEKAKFNLAGRAEESSGQKPEGMEPMGVKSPEA